jgi:TonB family protein
MEFRRILSYFETLMPIVRAILISLAVHVILTWSIGQVPSSWLPKKPQEVIVEIIDRSSLSEDLKKQVVRESVAPDEQKNEDESESARFFSAQKQRVLLETRAQKTGITKNRQMNEIAQKLADQKKLKRQVKEDDLFAKYKPIDFHRALQEEGLSTVGEALPTDVAVGSFSALNTDQFQFYSFYSRVEELVRFRWETRVREAIQFYDRRNLLNRIGNRNWISKMKFLLSPEGRLLKVEVLGESGIPAFDQAAILAFKEVLNFPNPPQDMIKADGLIHLQYSFNVHFNPMAVAR